MTQYQIIFFRHKHQHNIKMDTIMYLNIVTEKRCLTTAAASTD